MENEESPKQKGGLLIVKKNTDASKPPVFKAPAARSLLGLDVLAAQKRAEQQQQSVTGPTSIEWSKEESESTMGSIELGTLGTSGTTARNYRTKRIETPSHPGGLSEEAVAKLQQKRDADKARNIVGSSTKPRDNGNRKRRDDRDRYEDRGYGYSDRDRGYSRDSDRRRYEDRRSTSSSSRSGNWDSSTPRWIGSGGSNTPRRFDREGSKTPRIDDSRNRRFGGRSGPGGNTERIRSEWESATPALTSSHDEPSTERHPHFDDAEYKQWEQEQTQVDRDWYGAEEGGMTADETRDPFSQNEAYFRKKEEELTQKQVKKMSMRAKLKMQDYELWEQNLMVRSGVVQKGAADLDFADEEEKKVHIMVQELKPPFLDGRILYSKQLEPVRTVKDPTSDMAVQARKGSAVVKEFRERKERQKATQRAVQVAGSNIGNIMGVKSAVSTSSSSESLAPAVPSGPITVGMDQNPIGPDAPKKGSSFARTKSLREQREFLPVFAVREDLLKVIRDNQIIIIVGETGSGKTTQLTQYLHEGGYSTYGKIGCTQPRRVAAMSVAKRVSEEMGVKLGSEVGYSIRFEDCTSRSTVIKYMTDGVLLRELLKDPDIDNYSAIIMDEAHERSLHTDVLMGLLKKVVGRRRDLKLIVTSATMDSDKFSSFFGNAPVFSIPGRTFPVDIMFSKHNVEDYVEAAVKQALAIHLGGSAGDVLIFMTGQEDIEITCMMLADKMKELESPPPLAILPIYSQMPADLQAKIFEAAPDRARKVIVATNIAETSLTVDGICFVIDTGFNKLKVYNPRIGMDALQITPISQANANQRSGRAGRTGPGTCFRLYTELEFSQLFATTIPEIQRTNLSNVVLLLKSLNVRNLLEFDFMDPPPQDTILTSMQQLWVLGALDNTGELTALGKRMVEFPLEPSLSKLVIVADELKCTSEAVTIVSMLSVPNVFYRPKGREDESDASREKFFVPESDHLTLLNVFNQWKSNGYRDEWCEDHFIHNKAMKKAREVRTQLIDIMKNLRMEFSTAGANWDIIRKCISSAFFHHAARLKSIGEYINVQTGMPCHMHPTSALYGLGYTPDYIVYHELLLTSKEFMMCVTAVDPYWLAEYGNKIYSVKESNFGRREKRKLEIAQERSMEEELKEVVEKKRKEEEALLKREMTPRTQIIDMGAGSKTPRLREPGTPRISARRGL